MRESVIRHVAEHLRPKLMASSNASIVRCSADSVSSTETIDAEVWQTVAAAVAANDRDAMAATYHPDAVLVSTTGTTSVQHQLVIWGAGMEKIRYENRQASVDFRFATRQDGETTAFETGMFRYAETDANGVEQPVFVPMEALLVQKVRKHGCVACCAAGFACCVTYTSRLQEGRWVMLMERQLEPEDEAAWDALAS